MRTAREANPTRLLEVALDDLLYGGNWVGEKKEIINYVAEVRDPLWTDEEHDEIVEKLDDWHGDSHYKITTNWTFPENPKTGLTGDLKPTDETGDYFKALVTPNNQIRSIIDKIDQWGRVNRACAQVWDRRDDINDMYPPCLMTIQILYRDGKVNLTAYFRSHTVAKSYYGDITALGRLQSWVAQEIDAEVGVLTVMSGSLHIRKKNNEDELAEELAEVFKE